MPTDHPDGTSPVALIMADIMMPVDIQAQYVTLDVDITAQSIGNIDIDIAAQSVGNLDINIAASAVTLNVNISSQSANIDVNIAASDVTINVAVTGIANIEITAQSIGVYLQPHWASKEGQAKGWRKGDTVVANNNYIEVGYDVPLGKTVYVTHAGAGLYGEADADKEKNQVGNFKVDGVDGGAVDVGLNAGISCDFSQPLVAPEGSYLHLILRNRSGHSCYGYMQCNGYEV